MKHARTGKPPGLPALLLTALVAATLFSSVAVVLYALQGTGSGADGMSLGRVVATYYVSGTAAALIVRILRPLQRELLGRILVALIASSFVAVSIGVTKFSELPMHWGRTQWIVASAVWAMLSAVGVLVVLNPPSNPD